MTDRFKMPWRSRAEVHATSDGSSNAVGRPGWMNFSDGAFAGLGPANHATMARVGPPGMGSRQSCEFLLKHLKLDVNLAAYHHYFQGAEIGDTG